MLQDRTIEETNALDLLASVGELEKSVASEIRSQRSCERFNTKCKVSVHAGNASDYTKEVVQAISGDVSASGCLLLAAHPLHVGDVYCLHFDKNVLPIAPVFARCVRCRLLREDAFETGMSFFTRVDLPESLTNSTSDLLG